MRVGRPIRYYTNCSCIIFWPKTKALYKRYQNGKSPCVSNTTRTTYATTYIQIISNIVSTFSSFDSHAINFNRVIPNAAVLPNNKGNNEHVVGT